MQTKLRRGVFLASLFIIFLVFGLLIAQKNVFAVAGEVEYQSLHQFPQLFQYIDKAGELVAQYRTGYENMNDLEDPIVRCSHDLWKEGSVCPDESEVRLKEIEIDGQHNRFKVYIPPGSSYVNLNVFLSQPAYFLAVARLGIPPQADYSNYLKNISDLDYSSIPAMAKGVEELGKGDCVIKSSSGYITIAHDFPENFTEGKWLYVLLLEKSGSVLKSQYTNTVISDIYRPWFKTVSWLPNGDPGVTTPSVPAPTTPTSTPTPTPTPTNPNSTLPTGPDCAQKVCLGNSCWNGTTWIPGTKTTDCSGGEAKASPNSVTPIKEWTTEQRAEEISYLTWTTNSQTKHLEVACTGPAPIARANMQLTSALWQTQAAKDGSYLKQPNEPDGYPGWFHVGTSGTAICTFYPTNKADGLPGTPFSIKIEVKASGGGGACDNNVDLGITILVLDDVSVSDKIEADFRKAVSFIEGNSKFKLNYKIVQSNLPHSYTKYDCPEGKQTCVVVNKEDINQEVIKKLPASKFYFIFWKANGTPVLQAGSTWGVSDGILKDGVQRPYSTVAVDPWWYNREPFEGFEYRSSQLISHELVNLIQSLTEVAPYNCASLTADDTGLAYTNESSRLEKMTDECYQKIATMNGGNTLCTGGAQKTCANFPGPSFCLGGITDVIATGTDANGCSIYGCKSEQDSAYDCQPDDPSCAKSTCKDVSCFDGCNYQKGLKDCVGRR